MARLRPHSNAMRGAVTPAGWLPTSSMMRSALWTLWIILVGSPCVLGKALAADAPLAGLWSGAAGRFLVARFRGAPV